LGWAHLMISRTGFTGDLGYELWTTPDQALALWDHLFEAGRCTGLRPIGSEALNIARLEAGFIITGYDFMPAAHLRARGPQAQPAGDGAGLADRLGQGPFHRQGAPCWQRGARGRSGPSSGWRSTATSRRRAILYHDRKTEVGVITGACWSPVLKKNIALAQMTRHAAGDEPLGRNLCLRELHYEKLMMRARVVDRPFFTPDRRRATPPGRF
jgi:aminomethyltransferase